MASLLLTAGRVRRTARNRDDEVAHAPLNVSRTLASHQGSNAGSRIHASHALCIVVAGEPEGCQVSPAGTRSLDQSSGFPGLRGGRLCRRIPLDELGN
jgi:hypothetical protein